MNYGDDNSSVHLFCNISRCFPEGAMVHSLLSIVILILSAHETPLSDDSIVVNTVYTVNHIKVACLSYQIISVNINGGINFMKSIYRQRIEDSKHSKPYSSATFFHFYFHLKLCVATAKITYICIIWKNICK